MPWFIGTDMDGTVTDVEAEGAPFWKAYFVDVAAILGQNQHEIARLADEKNELVKADPFRYPWVYAGHIVAPAVDPYMRASPVAKMILEQFGVFQSDPDAVDRLLDRILFKHNYPHAGTVPRQGAADFLARLHDLQQAGRIQASVVTNSRTDQAQQKIARIAADLDPVMREKVERIGNCLQGDARKMVVDPESDVYDVDEFMDIPGVPYRVTLRRPMYFNALNACRIRAEAAWSQVIVVGDVMQLDLTLPLALGAHVILVRNHFTPDCEMEFLRRHERGCVTYRLSEAMDIIQSLVS